MTESGSRGNPCEEDGFETKDNQELNRGNEDVPRTSQESISAGDSGILIDDVEFCRSLDKRADVPLLQSRDIRLETVPEEPSLEAEEDDGVPYDRGWAWMVVAGLFVNFLLLSGYMKSSGLIFVELLHKFNAPATHTALLFTIRAGFFSITGLYVMNVFLGRFGSRKLVLTGGIMMSLSAILSSVANQLILLICINSVLSAIAMATLISPGEVLVGHYFKKRRSLALSLAKCGASFGNVAIPPLITYLLTEYGLGGTLLLFGGICLNSLPAAMLLRPTSFFVKRRRRQPLRPPESDDDVAVIYSRETPVNAETTMGQPAEVVSSRIANDRIPETRPRKAVSDVHRATKISANNIAKADQAASDSRVQARKDNKKASPGCIESKTELTCSKHFDTLEGDLAALTMSSPDLHYMPSTSNPFRKRTFSEPPEAPSPIYRPEARRPPPSGLMDAISQSSMLKYMSMSSVDTVSVSVLPDAEQKERTYSIRSADFTGEERKGKVSWSCVRVLKIVLKCPQRLVFMLDFSLFRKPLFRLLALYVTVSPYVNITVDYLPALVSERGVSESQAALLLSLIGGLDLFCRLAVGFFADLKILRVPTMIIISFLILAVVTQFVRFMTSFGHFIALAVLQGVFGGVANCLAPVLIIEFVGLENMGKAIGICQLLSGVSLALIYPLLGYIRDTSGSYAMLYHVIGCGMLMAAVLLCCERPIKRLQSKREGKSHEDTAPGSQVQADSPNSR